MSHLRGVPRRRLLGTSLRSGVSVSLGVAAGPDAPRPFASVIDLVTGGAPGFDSAVTTHRIRTADSTERIRSSSFGVPVFVTMPKSQAK